ncbi:MAG: formate/nitrite transporter family protein [Mycoplasma sp.]|nr:formate/nitrite transporter family protein [Mycoplasma sp.]
MKSYKENFRNGIEYATHKLNSSWFKMILLGMLGSIYVGLAYMIFIMIIATWPGTIQDWQFDETTGRLISEFSVSISGPALFVAAALFPVGIVLIVFLGGSLFTSDNLTMLAWITKQKHSDGSDVKFKRIFIKWMYTLLGNILGGIMIGAICRAANFFNTDSYQYVLGYLIGKKISMEWYFVIASGFLCNILVAGSVWASLAASHSTAKFLLIYFPIWMFAISGFQHVVANCILFSMGLFYMIDPSEQYNLLMGMNFACNHDLFTLITSKEELTTLMNSSSWINVKGYAFKLSVTNMLPAAFGNWVSGSLFLPYTYYYLSEYYKNMKKNKIHNQF